MSLRHKFVLLLSSAGCALALMAAVPSPSKDTIESAAPQYFDTLAGVEVSADEGALVALRQQASFALGQLQTRTTGSR